LGFRARLASPGDQGLLVHGRFKASVLAPNGDLFELLTGPSGWAGTKRWRVQSTGRRALLHPGLVAWSNLESGFDRVTVELAEPQA